ncbi:hypothetical protein GGI43DRAFT_157299 [Trichoderma evansii]
MLIHQRRNVPEEADAQASCRLHACLRRSCRAQWNMLTTASRISESLVDRSCLCPWCRFFFFIGFGGAWPVTGMSFGKAGGASKTTSTPTCAKFSDVEALVVALEKRAGNFQARHLFISKRRVVHIPWACATPKRVHTRKGREASLTHILFSIPAQRSDLGPARLAASV